MLNLARGGDKSAAERVWAEVYAEVRAIAAAEISREFEGSASQADLQPTGLVSEIFLRVARASPGGREGAWENRRHFFGTVTKVCEYALVDLARARKAKMRGGGRTLVPLTFVAGELADERAADTAAEIDLPAALASLGRGYPRAAEVARLRYMLEFSNSEVARILGVSQSTVEKDWVFARAWLRRKLERAV